jgi:hypothetical protein
VDAWKRGNASAAVPVLRGLVARTDDAGALRYLGEILCERGDRAEGAALLQQWLGRFPSAVSLGLFTFRPGTTLLLARCQEALGRDGDASATVERFLSDWSGADPGLPLLAEAKAMRTRLAAVTPARK